MRFSRVGYWGFSIPTPIYRRRKCRKPIGTTCVRFYERLRVLFVPGLSIAESGSGDGFTGFCFRVRPTIWPGCPFTHARTHDALRDDGNPYPGYRRRDLGGRGVDQLGLPNGQLAEQEARTRRETEFSAEVQPQGTEVLGLIAEAIEEEKGNSERSPLWGKIGELYVTERFGVVLSREHAQGHDGRLGDDLVEIKTITSRKHRSFVRVIRHRFLDGGQRVESGLVNADDGVGPNVPNLPPDHITIQSIPFQDDDAKLGTSVHLFHVRPPCLLPSRLAAVRAWSRTDAPATGRHRDHH